MKKQPSPTASRMTRVWLPGRPSAAPRGAARTSATCAQRPRSPGRAASRRTEHDGDRRRTRRRRSAPPAASRLPGRQRDERRADQHRRRRAQPVARRRYRLRRAAAGRLHAPHLEQRHEREQQRHEEPIATPCSARRRRQAVRRACEGRSARRRREAPTAASASRASATPSRLPPARARAPAACRWPGSAGVRRAEALQHGDALASSAATKTRVTLETPMPPSTTIDEPDQAQVVLGPRQVLAESSRCAGTSATLTNSLREVARAASPRAPRCRCRSTCSRICWRARLPKPSRPVSRSPRESMRTRGPRLKPPTAAGLASMTPRIVKAACRSAIRSPTAMPELRQQLRPHQHAAVREQRVRVGLPPRARASRRAGTPARPPRSSTIRAAGLAASAGRTIVAVSTISVRCGDAGACARRRVDRRARCRRPGAVASRSRRPPRSATRASRARPPRTFWMTDRSATIAPTPMAMQRKKNSSRRQEARVSRTAMRRTNIMRTPAPAARRLRRSRRGRRAARSARRPARPARRRASRARASSARPVARRSSRSMMCWPLAVSRLPVGSSASRIGGSLASARAIATRCCSPPDSCDG